MAFFTIGAWALMEAAREAAASLTLAAVADARRLTTSTTAVPASAAADMAESIKGAEAAAAEARGMMTMRMRRRADAARGETRRASESAESDVSVSAVVCTGDVVRVSSLVSWAVSAERRIGHEIEPRRARREASQDERQTQTQTQLRSQLSSAQLSSAQLCARVMGRGGICFCDKCWLLLS